MLMKAMDCCDSAKTADLLAAESCTAGASGMCPHCKEWEER